jgi:hypothetical protein
VSDVSGFWVTDPLFELQDSDRFYPVMPGRTEAKKFPPYLFSLPQRGGSLVHKIASMSLDWYGHAKHTRNLVRRRQPRMIATLVCGGFRFVDSKSTRTCVVPAPDALLCGRCHGEPATFGKHGQATKAGIKRTVAGVKLGCVVKGY